MRLWVAIAAGMALTTAAQPGSRPVVITGGRVLDVASGSYRQATVVIGGDRITAVQPPEAPVPDNAQRLDATGQTVVPGLVDLDVQAAPSADLDVSYAYALSLAFGVTSLRVVDGALPWAVAQRDRVRRGDILAPRLFTAGPGLSARSIGVTAAGAVPGFGADSPFIAVNDPAGAVREVDRQANSEVDWVRTREGATPEVVRAAVGAARKRQVRISAAPGATAVLQLVQLRVNAIDGLRGPLKANEAAPRVEAAAGQPPAPATAATVDEAWQRMTPADLRAVALALAQSRVTLVPKLRLEAEACGQDDGKGRDAELELLPEPLRKGREGRLPGDPVRARGWRARVGFVKAVAAQRGVIAAGSGSARQGWPVPGFGLHRELSTLVSAGLSPADAIRAATVIAAETLGVGGSLGQVRPGFRADVFVVRGDPLADVSALREITHVIRGGEVLDRQALLASAKRAVGPVR
jgi:hypothetical protein